MEHDLESVNAAVSHDNSGDIRYCRFDGNGWLRTLAVTSDAASDWYPQRVLGLNGPHQGSSPRPLLSKLDYHKTANY